MLRRVCKPLTNHAKRWMRRLDTAWAKSLVRRDMFLPTKFGTRPIAAVAPLRVPGLVLALSAAFALAPIALEGADANGDTRTISIMNAHTNETGTVTFKRNGVYDAEGIKQLS